MTTESDVVVIHTDGACRGNPGPGGWGAVLRYRGRERRLNGASENTTNNRMELTAAIEALAALNRHSQVRLVTDSKYVKQGITEWLPGWKRRQWQTAGRQPVKNVDLWQQLDVLAAAHAIEWAWVRGHTGDEGNELADALANAAIDDLLSGRAATKETG